MFCLTFPVSRFLSPVSCLLFAVSYVLCAPHEARAGTSNRIVAIVNDEVITDGDLAAQMSALLDPDHPHTMDASQTARLRQQVLQRLIEEHLIVQEAKRLGVTVNADDVAERLQEIQRRLGSVEAYAQMLREANLSEEQLKNKLRNQLLVQKAIDRQVRSKIVMSPSEMSKAAPLGSSSAPPASEELRAEHVLVRVSEHRSSDDAKALASRIAEQLQKGVEMEQAVRDVAGGADDVEASVLEGVHKGQLLPELDDVLFHLNVGECSSPIQSRLGFHVVRVLARGASAHDPPTSSQALNQLYQGKFTKALTDWLAELKQHAYIELLDQ